MGANDDAVGLIHRRCAAIAGKPRSYGAAWVLAMILNDDAVADTPPLRGYRGQASLLQGGVGARDDPER